MSEIKLAKQFIERLQRNSYYLTITRLNLSGCDLMEISLLEMPQLEQANFSRNKIQSLASFRNCHRLTDLDLGHNQICSLDELEYLKDAKSLTCLCLDNNPCSEGGGRIAVLLQLPQEYSDACTRFYPEQRSLERETDGQSVATLLPNEVASSPRCDFAPEQIQEGIRYCSPRLPVEVTENSSPCHVEPAQEPWYNNGNEQEASNAAAWIYPNNAEGFRDPERSIQWGANESHIEPAQEPWYNNGTTASTTACVAAVTSYPERLEDSDAAAWTYPNNAEGFRDPEYRPSGREVPENSFPRHIEPAQEPWYNNGNGCTTASSTACVAAVTSYPERLEDSDAAAWTYPNNAEGFNDPEYLPSDRGLRRSIQSGAIEGTGFVRRQTQERIRYCSPRQPELVPEPWYYNGNGQEDRDAAAWTYPNNAEGFRDPEYRPSGRMVPENSFPRHIEPAKEPWYRQYWERQEASDAAGWIYANNGYDPFREPEYRPSGRASRRSIQWGANEGTGSVRRQFQERIHYSSPRQPELVPETSNWSGRSTARTRGVTPRHPERRQVGEIYPYNAEEIYDLEQQRRQHNVNLLSGTMALIREMDAPTLGALCQLIEDHLRYR